MPLILRSPTVQWLSNMAARTAQDLLLALCVPLLRQAVAMAMTRIFFRKVAFILYFRFWILVASPLCYLQMYWSEVLSSSELDQGYGNLYISLNFYK